MQKLVFLIFILFILCGVSNAQKTSWLNQIKQIQPLKSTEKNVEALFGKPTDRYADVGEYETEYGTLNVTYSEGKCDSNKDSEYDVAKGIVIKLEFSVSKMIKFTSVNINLLGFKKESATGIMDTFFYKNKELGITYEISNGWLSIIYITPANNYDYLNCSKKNNSNQL